MLCVLAWGEWETAIIVAFGRDVTSQGQVNLALILVPSQHRIPNLKKTNFYKLATKARSSQMEFRILAVFLGAKLS